MISQEFLRVISHGEPELLATGQRYLAILTTGWHLSYQTFRFLTWFFNLVKIFDANKQMYNFSYNVLTLSKTVALTVNCIKKFNQVKKPG